METPRPAAERAAPEPTPTVAAFRPDDEADGSIGGPLDDASAGPDDAPPDDPGSTRPRRPAPAATRPAVDAADPPPPTPASPSKGGHGGGGERERDRDDAAPLPDDLPFMQEELPAGFWDDPEPPPAGGVDPDTLPADGPRGPAPKRQAGARRATSPTSSAGAPPAAPRAAKILETAGEAGDPDAMMAVVEELFPGRILRVEAPIEAPIDAPVDDAGDALDLDEDAVPLEPDDD